MSAPLPAERLTAVLRAAQYLSNLTADQDPWGALAEALSTFFGFDLVLIVGADDGAPRLLHEAFARGVPVDEVLRVTIDEVRAVLASGFLGSQRLTSPACALAVLPLPRDRRTAAVAVVGRAGQESLSKEELEILLALGGLFGNVVARVETERELRDHRERLEELVAARTAELARSNASLARESAERRQAEEALAGAHAELHQIFQTAADGLWVVNADGTVRRVNEAHARALGVSAEEIVGRQCREVSPCPECGSPCCPVTRIAAGEPRIEAEMTRTRGEHVRQELVITTPFRAPDGSLLGVVQAFHDITQRKRDERALRESEAELRAADARKNDFMAMLSHELRNPLAPIRNSLFILERTPAGSEQAKRAHAVIDRQVRHLARLVDDLLDITRISRGKITLQPQPLDLNALVRRTVEDFRSLLDLSEVRLELALAAGPVFVNGDSIRLAQVVGNLLGNAAKFTPRGGVTRVSVGTDEAGARAVVRVEDTGVGIAAATLARLFQPFVQGETSLDRNKGGLGLGLALVRGLVELHGGVIDGHSAGVGQGAQFVVRLPTVPVPAAAAPAARPPAPGRARRVLIIEDNIDAADSLREALQFCGHQVAVAYDGPEGLAQARVQRPEVVLCDIGLPGMNGYEVARAFRGDEGLKAVELIALTGYALPEDLQRATEAGFNRHLAKPPSLAALRALLAGGAG
ncbi:MAG TPA: ATP-binding protein [Polyangia bacterium]|jgi:two-component system CheB/CheR fusion protein